MQGQPESEHEKEERWRKDARIFLFALLKHWHWWLGVTVGSGFVAVIGARMEDDSKKIPFWVYECALTIGLTVATFRAFCDQRRNTDAKELDLQNAIKDNAIDKLATEKKHAEEKQQLEAIISSLRTPSTSLLKTEIINPAERDPLTSKYTYRIRVKNTHSRKIIKDLKVWICEIEWPPMMEKPLFWNGLTWPYQLPAKESEDNSIPQNLAAGLEMEFDLFFVDSARNTRLINLAPFKPKNISSPSIFKSVESNTRFNIDILPQDNSRLVFKFMVSGGDGDVDTIKESFVLIIPPLLPNNDVKNQIANINSLIVEPNKYLPFFEKREEDEQPDDRATRKKIKDSLASWRMTIQNLTSQLRDIEYYAYHGEKRQKLEADYLNVKDTAYQYINDKVGASEAVSFIDNEQIPRVVLDGNTQFDIPEFKDRWIARQSMLHRLKFLAAQLEKIEGKLDSSDFILPL